MSEAGAPSFLHRLASRPALSLLLLCLIAWLPGALTLPPLDRDESRFAQASKQMIETGDLVDIHLGAATRYKKPAGIYWLQAASTALVGGAHDRIWTYRLPSLVGGYLALLFLFLCARAFAGPDTAFLAAALLGACVLMSAEAQIATTDAVLLAATLGAQAVFFRIYLAARDATRRPPRLALIAAGWFAIAFGVLVKGPMILAVPCLTAFAVSLWDRDWRWLKATNPLLGLLIIAIIAGPWLVAIEFRSHGAFYRQSLGHDFGAKIMGGQESHGAPPGYYLVLSALTFWPVILFAAPSLRASFSRRSEPAIRYLLSWAGAAWLMFELVPTKLPHYIIPVYAALAILAASWIVRPRGESEHRSVWLYIAVVQFVVGLAVFVLAAVVLPVFFGSGTNLGIAAFATIAGALGIAALVCLFRAKRLAASYAAIAAALLLIPLLAACVSPLLTTLWVSPRVAALVAEDRHAGDPPPVLAGYIEPSLIFLLGTQTRAGTGADAAAIAAHDGGLAVIEDRERASFLHGLGAVRAFPAGQVSGYNYSHGRKIHLTIYRVMPASNAAKPLQH
jgi:4-amino-4-deoxy-L-arabinose transferase-like glycosyltransferase